MDIPLKYDSETYCILDNAGKELFSICFADESDAEYAVNAINKYKDMIVLLSHIQREYNLHDDLKDKVDNLLNKLKY